MSANHGFELLREEIVPEVNSTVRLYRHIRTGAELLSLVNSDENKVFGITFRTPPIDSTGIAHIMEHSVLCGSRKYPVKEPFVELMKGSLNTFLNAMTYPDKTCYPVASQNLQDFYNLVDVYLDSVFYPNLDPFTLKQEGWHYELETPDAEMTFKGVVFNEMKGAYSSPDSVLDEMSQRSLYPDTNYSVDSGGDPERIPDLTYTQFVDFHRRYYHPSNSLIFFYGDDDPQKRLELLDAWLDSFEAQPVDAIVGLQPAFSAPRRSVHPYEVGDEDTQALHWFTHNWLLPEGSQAELSLGLGILENILIGNPAAPLRKALIDSGLGENLTGRGLESGLRQMFFSTGLKGVAEENVEKADALILSTLQSLADKGIDPGTVAAALNTVEFRMREYNTGSYPRGLLVMLNSLETWLYGGDPIQPLRFDAPLTAIKTKIAAGERYFEGLIRQYLLENPHHTTVILKPDPDLSRRRAEKEQARLSSARAAMSEADLMQVVEGTLELQRRQKAADSPEALATIPGLRRSDLEPDIRTIPSELITANGCPPVLLHDLFTNGILYLDLGFDMHCLPAEWLPYVPLFGRALLETGTDQENFVQLVQRIGRTTGGIHQSSLTSAALHRERGQAWFLLRGKAMLAQTGDLLTIIQDVLRTARLDDRERIRQMALESRASLESHLVDRGHQVVNSRLKARFSESDWAAEQMGGVSYLFFLRDLIERMDREWPAVQAIFEGIRARLINRSSAICNVTVNAEEWAQVQGTVNAFLSALPDAPVEFHPWLIPIPQEHEGLTIRTQVNYVGKGANLYAAGYQPHGSAHVIVNYLRSTWLWNKVRVQGGAYGGFCLFDRQSGVFSYLSYRDPNLAATLRSYDETVDFLASLELDEEELTRAIIGTIGDIDAYMLPDAKGFTALTRHLLGITDEERQKNRSEILNTTPADFRAFADTLAKVRDHGDVVVLGSEDAIHAAETDGLQLKTVKVL